MDSLVIKYLIFHISFFLASKHFSEQILFNHWDVFSYLTPKYYFETITKLLVTFSIVWKEIPIGKFEVTLRPIVSRPVCLCHAPVWDQRPISLLIWIIFRQLLVCWRKDRYIICNCCWDAPTQSFRLVTSSASEDEAILSYLIAAWSGSKQNSLWYVSGTTVNQKSLVLSLWP
jgi:hypothetical protein